MRLTVKNTPEHNTFSTYARVIWQWFHVFASPRLKVDIYGIFHMRTPPLFRASRGYTGESTHSFAHLSLAHTDTYTRAHHSRSKLFDCTHSTHTHTCIARRPDLHLSCCDGVIFVHPSRNALASLGGVQKRLGLGVTHAGRRSNCSCESKLSQAVCRASVSLAEHSLQLRKRKDKGLLVCMWKGVM